MSTPAQDTARRLIAERGPMPDHLVQSIARRLVKANGEPQAERKPA